MRLALTLLCRNEQDVIKSTIEFHLRHGVDLIIATDNGSVDDTPQILETYQQQGVLHLLHEPSHTHDQAVWVTRMARMAASDFEADWVINTDADEFWWPRSGNLKAELAALPIDAQALQVERLNFLPPPSDSDPRLPFHQRQTIRERHSLNSLGRPLPAKVCHRGHQFIEVKDGNHAVSLEGRTVQGLTSDRIEILHFPIRSYEQLERKIREGANALERNQRVSPQVGRTWRHLYKDVLLEGMLPEYYASLQPSRSRLESGELIEDHRLQADLADPPSHA